MISVVSAYFVSNERNMGPLPSHPSYEGVEYILYTNSPKKVPKNSPWEIRYIDPKNSGRLKAREIKSLIHTYLPDSDFWIWLDSNMLLRKNPNDIIKNHLKDHDICALPHPERHNYWEEALICSELFKGEVENIQKLVNKFYTEGCLPTFLCETGCLIRPNTPKVVKFNEIWWDHIKVCHRDQISFPYAIWKSNLSLTTFPGTNSTRKIRLEYKDYIHPYKEITREWIGGYTDRKQP